MVTEYLMTGFADLAAAAAAAAGADPASGKGAAESSRSRFLIPGLQQVPFFFAGLVVPPQWADLLPGHCRQKLKGDPGGSQPATELALRPHKAIRAVAGRLLRSMNSRRAPEPGTNASPRGRRAASRLGTKGHALAGGSQSSGAYDSRFPFPAQAAGAAATVSPRKAEHCHLPLACLARAPPGGSTEETTR